MRIEDRMEFKTKSPVLTFAADDMVMDAVQMMSEKNYGASIVIDTARRPIGVVTERDLALRVCAENEEAKDISISDVMTPHAITCRPTHSIGEVTRQMLLHHHSVLAVADDDERPLGVISLRDIFEATAGAAS